MRCDQDDQDTSAPTLLQPQVEDNSCWLRGSNETLLGPANVQSLPLRVE